MSRWSTGWLLAGVVSVAAFNTGFGEEGVVGENKSGAEVSREAIVERVRADIEFFASDALEGRGIDTKGIETAALRILDEYKRLGLKPGMPDGSYRQPFPVSMGEAVIADSTAVELAGPDGVKLSLKINDQFQPVRRGANGSASGDVVFIGYGITSEEDKYNDYANINVEGKIVVLMRREPLQGQADGPFNGTQTSPNSFIDRKLQLVTGAKAAAVIFVNDVFSSPTPDKDDLTPPSAFGSDGNSVPFAHVKQAVVDQMLKASPLKTADGKMLASLAEVSTHIDESLQPVSQPLAGWSATVNTAFESNDVSTDNLIGVIEGEGPLAHETIIIGAHYDHIGYGAFGSRAPNRKGEIHNGADDNATGTAAVIELARRVAAGPKPKRRMVFICFTAEERGLLGSAYYVRSPVFPLEDTVFMLNFDMIGNLRENKVEMHGTGSAVEFADVIKATDEASPVEVTSVDSPFGGSDHLPFFQKQIPVMFCHTGLTGTYHTPDDDYETLNIEGAVTVTDYSEQVLMAIDAMDKRPTFKDVSRPSRRGRLPVIGLVPDLTNTEAGGVVVKEVRPDTPAAKAGIVAGDIVVKIGDTKVDSQQTMGQAMSRLRAGEKVKVVVKRGEDEIETIVELGAPQN